MRLPDPIPFDGALSSGTPSEVSRRAVLCVGGALGALAATSPTRVQAQAALPVPPPGITPQALAADETHWARVAALYPADRSILNLENGYFGMMATPVAQAYQRHIERVNSQGAAFVRTQYDGAVAGRIRERVAGELGVSTDEIALTRGATEALQNLIGNFQRLAPGDVAMYADLDYDSMQYAMNWLRERRGAEVVKITLPEPATHQGLIDTYARALEQHPRTRLLLLTHLSHRTGLVVPVAEIVKLARSRGVEVIVDAAHAWGQLDFDFPSLGVDFAGFNLHKWMGAPLGVGFLYIRKSRIADIGRAFDDGDHAPDDIRARVHTGTTNIANVMAVPDALDLHRAIGPAAKAARLRHLRDRWVAQVRELPKLQVLTPDDPRLVGGITSIRLMGKTTREDNLRLAARLREEFGIFSVRRGGVAAGDCVRISPALFTSAADVDRLAQALRVVAV
jgi:selenocysteine lyase/cysteine desulfurase